jgi:microcin C transport system substrate-binding protein
MAELTALLAAPHRRPSPPDERTIRFDFKRRNHELHMILGSLPVFSRKWGAGKPFDQIVQEPPITSGPYRLERADWGKTITFSRRDDYWAKDLPVNRGRFNFDEIRFEYFRERTAAFEALKAGKLDLREEFTSRDWATGYDFPALADGRVVKVVLPDETPSGAQGFFFNLRREKFQDIRVRQALNLAFDFEWTNKNLFFSLYNRTASFFELSPLKAGGLPPPDELALLKAWIDAGQPE